MRQHFFIGLLCLLLPLTSCVQRMIEYPYAENNTSVSRYFGTEVGDDYQWMEIHPGNNSKLKNWLNAQDELTAAYFSGGTTRVFDRMQELLAFPRFSFIRSSTDTLYYAGIYPYESKIDIHKYADNRDSFIKQVNLPTYKNGEFNSLIFQDGSHLALIAGDTSGKSHIYIYNLRDNSVDPVRIIRNVIDCKLTPRDNGSFFFVRDAFASENTVLGINSIMVCDYKVSADNLDLNIHNFYTDSEGSSGNIFDMVYDGENRNVYIGKYAIDDVSGFVVYELSHRNNNPKPVISFSVPVGEEYRLAGTDDVNLYFIVVEPTMSGSLLAVNKQTMQCDTVIHHASMSLGYFSMIKDHAVLSFRNETSNKIYFVNKHTLAKQVIPVPDNQFYFFNHNKVSQKIYYYKESLVAPKEVHLVDSIDFNKRTKINQSRKLPFNPDDYVIENHQSYTPSGETVRFQICYKKGLVRDGSAPLIIHSFVNAEHAYLDRFNFSRILYMDLGFVFVQRSHVDTHKQVDISSRADDLYAAYRYLIDNKYSSDGKIGIIGREFGASALFIALNRYPINAPVVLADGIYDFVDYNNRGKLLYQNHKVFQANDSLSFRSVYDRSPYHSVVPKKSYPPMLLISSENNRLIPAYHTYKMAAKLQMRTRATHPVILITPGHVKYLDQYESYSYKTSVDQALHFLAPYLGVELN